MKSATCDLNHGLRITGLALCLAVLSSETWAGGILIYEAGQESNGLANAGAAALATDPSVLMSNPAGIAELQGTQVSANAQLTTGRSARQRVPGASR